MKPTLSFLIIVKMEMCFYKEEEELTNRINIFSDDCGKSSLSNL